MSRPKSQQIKRETLDKNTLSKSNKTDSTKKKRVRFVNEGRSSDKRPKSISPENSSDFPNLPSLSSLKEQVAFLAKQLDCKDEIEASDESEEMSSSSKKSKDLVNEKVDFDAMSPREQLAFLSAEVSEEESNDEYDDEDEEDYLEELQPRKSKRRVSKVEMDQSGSEEENEDFSKDSDGEKYKDSEQESEEGEDQDALSDSEFFRDLPKTGVSKNSSKKSKDRDSEEEDFDDEADDVSDSDLTPFQRQQLAIAKKINKMEQEQVRKLQGTLQKKAKGKKKGSDDDSDSSSISNMEWTMKGEITAKARPKNSLLMLGEEELDFEQAVQMNNKQHLADNRSSNEVDESINLAMPKKTIEQVIIDRIKEELWDDVQPRAPVSVQLVTQGAAEQAKKHIMLEDTEAGQKSTQSLAQIYETEYAKATQKLKANSSNNNQKEGQEGKVAFTHDSTNTDDKVQELRNAALARYAKICNMLDTLISGNVLGGEKRAIKTRLGKGTRTINPIFMSTTLLPFAGAAPPQSFAKNMLGRKQQNPSQ